MKPILTLYTALLLLPLAALQAADATPARKPNVLFILADDLGWSDTTLYGTTRFYQTPNVERLAKRGVTFTRAYSASPLCSPTRSAILTGLSPARTGITAPNGHDPKVILQATPGNKAAPDQKAIMPNVVTRLLTTYPTLSRSLNDAGYATGHFGKWHLGPEPYSPLQHGFDVDLPHWPGPGPAGSFVAPWKFKDFDPDAGVPDQHIEDRMAKDASAFMEQHKDGPFFLNYWMFSVHAPFNAKKALIEKHRARVDPNDPQRSPTYAAMVESMDDAIGTLLDTLDRLKIADHTIIIFTSDNGGNMYNRVDDTTPTNNTPFRGGKASMFEGGTRVPCVVVWPGITTADSRSDAIVQSEDYYPTLLEGLDLKPAEGQRFDGASILPALKGDPLAGKAVFQYFPHSPGVPDWLPPSVSVHRGDWKLIRIFHGGENGAHRHLLFNLRDDPGEKNNLVVQKPALITELDALIETFLTETNAVVPVPNPEFDPAKYRPELEGIQTNRDKPLATTTLTAAPPNVVIFLADDAGWGDFSHSGNTQVQTPHIDSLAREGVSLDRFFVQPVCSPTRAEMLTGRYHPRGGVRGVSTGGERLDLGEKTLADAFKAAGFATGCFGKWHNGSQWPYHPMARGFDEYLGHTAGHWGEYFDAPLEENGHMIRTKGYIVDVCTDRALAFIDKYKAKPFFCYIPFTTPHSPWAAPQEDWQRFKDRPIHQHATQAAKEAPDQTRCALAMMESQDRNVGRVLARLREHRIEENTIVLYFSDNGPNSMRWTGGMKGNKGTTDEGGVRSVCYMRWPAKLPAGHNVTQIAGAIDLLPTLTALAGVKRASEHPLDGRDLTPLLTRQNPEWPDRMIFSSWGGHISVRTQTHRLDHAGQLFDMIADSAQTKPVNAAQPELTARLTAAAQAWRTEMFGKNATTKSKGKGHGNAVDPRPIPVGYREFPITMLPARDGEPRGGVQRSSDAPNCSYFVNWTNKDDSMVWLLDVHTAGKYEVSVDYTCKVPDADSTIELAFQDAKLSGKVEPGWDPPLHTNQDTLPRPQGESQMKEFHTLMLGQITLPAGRGPLTLRALNIPGSSVMDVRRINLSLLP